MFIIGVDYFLANIESMARLVVARDASLNRVGQGSGYS